MLSTDGRRSFAVFIYAGDRIALIARPRQIGFNAGDGSRWSNIEIRSLESVNIFRIDGGWMDNNVSYSIVAIGIQY